MCRVRHRTFDRVFRAADRHGRGPHATEALLRLIGIEATIDVAAHGDDAASSKPAPDIVIAALEKAELDASCAVLLGDTPYEVEAATAADVAAIALRRGGRSDDDLRGSVEIYDDPAALLETLGG